MEPPNAYERHQKLISDFQKFYGGASASSKPTPVVTDVDLLRKAHRFIDDNGDDESTYESRLAKRYYDQLHKEYCLADLSRFRKSEIGLRWRTQQEVFVGKGQFECAALDCDERSGLRSFEVEFNYREGGAAKVALVKVRVCRECSFRLNFKHFKRIAAEKRKSAKRRESSKRQRKEAADEPRDESDADEPAPQSDVGQRADALLAEVEAMLTAEANARTRASTKAEEPAFNGLFL
jgi:protein FRA10AC1